MTEYRSASAASWFGNKPGEPYSTDGAVNSSSAYGWRQDDFYRLDPASQRAVLEEAHAIGNLMNYARSLTPPTPAPNAGRFNLPIAAAVRCCVQPAPDTAHDPHCPAYGYPVPTWAALNNCPHDVLCGSRDECDTRERIMARVAEQKPWDDRTCEPYCCCERCESRAYAQGDAAALIGAAERADAAAERSATRDLTEDARRTVGQAPVLSYGDLIPAAAGVEWADLAGWAYAADQRVVMSPDGYLWCRGAYEGHDQGCKYYSNAKLQADTDDIPDPTPVRSLVVWLARHWGCTDGE